MMRPRTAPLLPPKGIFVSTRLLFDPSLSADLKDTLIQLMALSWMNRSHTTPACPVCGQRGGHARSCARGNPRRCPADF